MKKDLVVKFNGEMVVKAKDRPDDLGSLGHWLVNYMEDAIKSAESTDEVFDKLNMEFELEERRP